MLFQVLELLILLKRNLQIEKRKVKFQTNQEFGESYFYRGYALAKINNIKKAIKDFDKALEKSLYCIDYEFLGKLDGEAKDILETKLKLLYFFFK